HRAAGRARGRRAAGGRGRAQRQPGRSAAGADPEGIRSAGVPRRPPGPGGFPSRAVGGGMATAIGRRGPNDRRSSVLAASEGGRVRREASLPAHRAGGRIPVGGAGLRAGLAYITAATTAIAAFAFLLPLGWELRSDHRDQAMTLAEKQTATVA